VSLGDNPRLGDPAASGTRLWQVLEQADLADWVRAQGGAGLDLMLTETGANLSGGERQRGAGQHGVAAGAATFGKRLGKAGALGGGGAAVEHPDGEGDGVFGRSHAGRAAQRGAKGGGAGHRLAQRAEIGKGKRQALTPGDQRIGTVGAHPFQPRDELG